MKQLKPKKNIPHIIKYMGGKKKLLPFLISNINEIYEGEAVCDLFAGTSVLSGALRNSTVMYSNDIQEYSAIFAKTYLGSYDWSVIDNLVDRVIHAAQTHVDAVHKKYSKNIYKYDDNLSLDDFNAIEYEQQQLIYHDFCGIKNHLFIKNYSGTYWSFEQCLWIDAIREVAEAYVHTPVYFPIISSLMFAMAYNAQSTGHYAQYRDATNKASKNDIIIYRKKEILPYFRKKMGEFIRVLAKNNFKSTVTSLDFRDCLNSLPAKTLIYADPPYTFVHYSRFYHALETLVKYDYPEVKFKGRYRSDRHQSPFCKKTEVVNAFSEMFRIIRDKESKLILSYSNTGMITLRELVDLARSVFGVNYDITQKSIDYEHSTMGRSKDKCRGVKEFLIIAKPGKP